MMERAKPVATPGDESGSAVPADAQRDPWIGQAIKAWYRVSRRLAAGPSGNLYIAHAGETGAEVTLKLLPAGIALDDDLARRLGDELSVTRAVARIRPNVAIVLDCDRTADGRAFIVLEPLEGRSLADLIRQEGPLPVKRALHLAFQIADCLQAAHNLVLVHGALDAEHVLVGAGDTVKLTGFEVSRLGGDPTSRVHVEGAHTAHAGGLTERADIQALGMLLMHMLTGAVQPRSEGSGARAARTLGREVPAPVRELVMQTLIRSPEPRAHDMGSVANALWVELYRVTERPVPTVRRSARAVRPRVRWPQVRWRAVGIGALVVAVIALGAWVTRYRATAPPPVTSVMQPAPAPQSPPTPAPSVPEPATVGQSAEGVASPPPQPLPRPESIPPTRPAVTSTPPVTPEVVPVTPRATPPVPAPPATRTPPPATVTPPPPAPAERAEATARVPVRPAPQSGAARQEPRPERDTADPSAIIDWLLKDSPRQQR